MRKLDFYGLPRSLQDRFIESTRGASAPVPLAFAPRAQRLPLLWGLGALLSLVAWGGFTAFGFGDLQNAWALGSVRHLCVHMSLAGLTLFCALRSYAAAWEASRAFYLDGAYLFSSGIILARGRRLTELDAASLPRVKTEGGSVVIEGEGGARFVFAAGDAGRAESVRAAYESGRERWMSLDSKDALERARMHAFTESGIPNPLAPTEPRREPRWISPLVLAPLVGVFALALGFAVFSLRNSFSEKELYRAAVQANTVESYRAYLERGGSRSDVAELFLPRAELELALRDGTVTAIESFIGRHPSTQIQEEVQAVHRAALLGELQRAEARGGLAAIEEIRRRFPAHGLIEAELAAARHAVFVRAFEAFREGAAEKNAELLPFVQKLLDYAEKRGPVVQVRVQHRFPQSREMLDSIVSKSEKYYLGRKSLPTQYFLGEPAQKREIAFSEALLARLQSAFPEEVLRFEFLGPSSGENQELPEAEQPTLTLMHQESLSGGFVGGKPRSMYLGATVLMTAELSLPKSVAVAPLVFKWSAWRAPNFTLLIDKDIPEVYEDMLGGAFDGFRQAYLATWFRSP